MRSGTLAAGAEDLGAHRSQLIPLYVCLLQQSLADQSALFLMSATSLVSAPVRQGNCMISLRPIGGEGFLIATATLNIVLPYTLLSKSTAPLLSKAYHDLSTRSRAGHYQLPVIHIYLSFGSRKHIRF